MQQLTIITVSLHQDDALERTISSVQSWMAEAKLFEVSIWNIRYFIIHSDLNFCDLQLERGTGFSPEIYYTPPSGVYGAMNAALDRLDFGYVWFINAGDNCVSGTSAEILRILNFSPCILRSQSKYLGAGQEWVAPSDSKICDFRFFSHQALIADRALFKPGFDSRFLLSGDKESYYRMLSNAKCIVTLKKVICVMSVGGISQSGGKEFRKFYEDFLIDRKYGYLNLKILSLRFFKTLFKYFGSRILPRSLYYGFLSRFVR